MTNKCLFRKDNIIFRTYNNENIENIEICDKKEQYQHQNLNI